MLILNNNSCYNYIYINKIKRSLYMTNGIYNNFPGLSPWTQFKLELGSIYKNAGIEFNKITNFIKNLYYQVFPKPTFEQKIENKFNKFLNYIAPKPQKTAADKVRDFFNNF